MKITGGQAKGILIKVADKPTVRPATDYLRQAVFSSLGTLVSHSKFLDLFAGTGAYGLEAWSRGASNGIFIEKDRLCIATIKHNITVVAKSAHRNPLDCKVIQANVFSSPLLPEHQFDLVFADPPYEITGDIFETLLKLATQYLSKKPTSRLIIEVPGHLTPPEHTDLAFIKKLGKNNKDSPSALIARFK